MPQIRYKDQSAVIDRGFDIMKLIPGLSLLLSSLIEMHAPILVQKTEVSGLITDL